MSNRQNFRFGFAVACTLAIGAAAALTAAGPRASRSVAQAGPATNSASLNHLMTNQWYNLEAGAVVYPSDYIDDQGAADQTRLHQPLALSQGTQVLVVAVDHAQSTATLAFNLEGQDDDEDNPLPSQVTVDLKDLSSAHPNLISFEGFEGTDASAKADLDDDDAVAASAEFAKKKNIKSGSALRQKSTGSGRVIRVRSKGGMTMCLAEVRVNAGSICGQTMPSISRAAQGYDLYKSKGWTPVAFDPKNAKLCTACFWKGGRKDCSGGVECGHASLKIGANQWIGAGIRPVPQLPNQNGCKRGKNGRKVCRVPYRLDGCLLAPGH